MHCKDCRWWNNITNNSWKFCNNQDSPTKGYAFPANFGCIHFKKKQGVIKIGLSFDSPIAFNSKLIDAFGELGFYREDSGGDGKTTYFVFKEKEDERQIKKP